MLCKGHVIIIITYHNTSLFIFPESSDACGQWLPVLPLSLSPLTLSFPFFLQDKKKKVWMIYLCFSCMFGHLSSILGVWKTCFVVIAILFSAMYHMIECILCFILFQMDIYLQWISLPKHYLKHQTEYCHLWLLIITENFSHTHIVGFLPLSSQIH